MDVCVYMLALPGWYRWTGPSPASLLNSLCRFKNKICKLSKQRADAHIWNCSQRLAIMMSHKCSTRFKRVVIQPQTIVVFHSSFLRGNKLVLSSYLFQLLCRSFILSSSVFTTILVKKKSFIMVPRTVYVVCPWRSHVCLLPGHNNTNKLCKQVTARKETAIIFG